MSQLSTGFIDGTTGLDIAAPLVDKSYLIDRYPELANTFRFAGLWLWGYNGYGQLGDNTNISRSSPVQTIAGGENWRMVSAGHYHTAAVKTDGTLWSWGANQYGQLGDTTSTHRSSPIQTVAGGTTWKQVSAARYLTAAIKTDGTLWIWGRNQYGQLGDNTVVSKSSPVQTTAGGTNWKQVSAWLWMTAAIKTDGTLWTWGQNNYGELGDNTITHRSSPVQTVAGGTNWRLVSAGYYQTSAIKTDGTLWLWGYNGGGGLGDNTITHRSSPVQTVAGGTNWKQVSGAGFTIGLNTAAVKTDGSLWLWGTNLFGGLGDNTITHRSSPVQTVAGGTNWKQASGAGGNTAAVKTDGTLWTWGYNYDGELSDNTVVSKSSPVQTIAGGTNWKQVAEGYYHTAAIRDDSSDMFGNPL